MINQFGSLISKIAGNDVSVSVIGVIVSVALLAGIVYMLVRPYKEATKLTEKVKVK